MFNKFAHYLSYGSTDQETVRKLSKCFEGLLIPGTIAAFQSEGTKGFVLTLTARSGEPYVIDPRFPLFQNRLTRPKKSHLMLADILGLPSLVNSSATPIPRDLSIDEIRLISERWIDFNNNFENVTPKTFEKYAARLKEEVMQVKRQKPKFILPPYAMVTSEGDGWWELSKQLWKMATNHATSLGVENKLRRVVAAGDPKTWGILVSEISDEEVVGWVSNLNEFERNSEELLKDYGRALRKAHGRGQMVFALYGGFFSVLLARYGLTGASHGIGFGEHRDSIELPTSGAPPARYYVPRLHRYIGVEIAVHLWRQFPSLISCDCLDCNGGSPTDLDYHGLMRHSVRVRNVEISEWVNLPTSEVVKRLRLTSTEFDYALNKLIAPQRVIEGAKATYPHLKMWARVLEELG